MADPTHALSALDIILYAATSIGGVVGGVVAAVLRFGTRVKALEDTSTKFRTDLDEQKRSAHSSAPGTLLMKPDKAAVNALVDQRVHVTIASYKAGLATEIATLSAHYTSLKEEQDRMRDTSEREAQEGARRWSEMSASIARLGALIQNG